MRTIRVLNLAVEAYPHFWEEVDDQTLDTIDDLVEEVNGELVEALQEKLDAAGFSGKVVVNKFLTED